MRNPLNRVTLETEVAASYARDGFMDDIVLPLNGWMDFTNALQLPGTEMIFGFVGNQLCLEFNGTAGAAQTHIAQQKFTLPHWWHVNMDDPNSRRLQLKALLRKADDGGAENADLTLNADIYWTAPGQSEDHLASPVTFLLPAKVSAVATNNLVLATYDLWAAMTLAQKRTLVRASSISVRLNTNEAVGAGLNVQVADSWLHVRRHLRSHA